MNIRKKYIPPIIIKYEIKMEDSLSSASARIDPLNGNEQIIETWVEDPDDRKSFTW